MPKLPTISFVFDRKKTSSPSTKGDVEACIYYNKKRSFHKVGIKLYSTQWNDRYMVMNHYSSKELNDTLVAIAQDFNAFVYELGKKHEEFTLEKATNWWNSSSSVNGDSFVDYMTGIIRERQDLRDTTKKQHVVVLEAIIDYGKIKSFDDLTPANLRAFDRWLHNKNRTTATIYNYHKRLKSYINIAIREGRFTGRNPYEIEKFERGKSKPRVYLTDDELDHLMEIDFGTTYLNNVRDMFAFQALTGLSYVELCNFDFKKDVQEVDGKYILRKRRIKTNVDFITVITPTAMNILRQHDYQFDVISNTKYNLYLKPISKVLGLPKPLTTHCARHTFAVRALNKGIPIEVVAKILGHTDIRTTQIYAKIVDETVIDAFDVL